MSVYMISFASRQAVFLQHQCADVTSKPIFRVCMMCCLAELVASLSGKTLPVSKQLLVCNFGSMQHMSCCVFSKWLLALLTHKAHASYSCLARSSASDCAIAVSIKASSKRR